METRLTEKIKEEWSYEANPDEHKYELAQDEVNYAEEEE